ncbi:MAG: hypothetical protein JXB19_11100 [Bacteroidales bacterium]|nr:hypothetical protein [Bacteroidales bacterium]
MLLWQCRESSDRDQALNPFIMEHTIENAIDTLVERFGETRLERITRGVTQTASFWRDTDGTQEDFIEFCKNNYIDDPVMAEEVFNRISANFETIFGYYTKITLDIRRPLELDIGLILPVDETFGSYSPFTHFTDDFFASKMAFYIMLNFPYYSLEEKSVHAAEWSRIEWAFARLGDVFDSRLPAEVNQNLVNVSTRSDIYISDYNIYAGNLVDAEGNTFFPPGMKLLSHWNLRDEIKANYGREGGPEKQNMLYEVMKRIITQEIPREVINSEEYQWNPFENTVFRYGEQIPATPEKDVRFAHLLDFFHAQQRIDPYYPKLNTYLKRNFESGMEIPLDEVERLFIEFLSSPEVRQVAEVVRSRLNRELQPFDIWYDGFKARTGIAPETLDEACRKRYPDPQAVQEDLPNILIRLGFSREKATEIASKIQVDPARGSGHAAGSEIRSEKSLLRTRIFPEGMDYKGYNIAIHEFGHNVEQTISLHSVDHYMLHGVPNTAFTEALAFIFQHRDLELLGYEDQDRLKDALDDLDSFWSLNEIMAVSLVDIGTWKWLYENPSATSVDLRDAVNRISVDIWNSYFAEIFGISDQPVLGIYSHMISYPLYLPNYAYGQIIEFQLEEQLQGKNFGAEIERIFSLGRLTPEQWMLEATGDKISVQPIFRSVREALETVNSGR